MLEKAFAKVYTKFKLKFYQSVFDSVQNNAKDLSVLETFCVEVINALGRPTVSEFSEFAQLSSPNATYKINSLIRKGYIRKTRSTEDKREYYLEVSEKYIHMNGRSYRYMALVMQRIREHFSPEDAEKIEYLLQTMSDELMPEIKLNPNVDTLLEDNQK